MRYTLALAMAAILISGCATKTYTFTPINETVPMRANTAALTIIAPQNFHIGVAFSMFTNYDYFLDCLEDSCKAGKMNALQYITLYPAQGKHTLYTKLSEDGFTNSLIVIDKNATTSISFDVNTTNRSYVLHEWELSSASLMMPLAAEPSILKVIDEDNAKILLQKIIDGDDRIAAGFISKQGITYQH